MVNGVLMPKAGITVESCIIGKWRKAVGDRVAVGDILFDYETDKASFECESTAGGELLEIFFQDGDEVPCLVNVCAIGTKGEDCASLRPVGTTPAAPSAPAEEAPGVRAELTPSAPAGTGAPVSPRARKLAETAGVDAAQAAGTGPNGRIIERDVRRLMSEGAPVREALPVEEEAFAARDSGLSSGEAEYEDVKFSNIRRVIARGMVNSLQAMAQLTEHFSFDASAIQGYRKLLKGMEGDCAGITLGDMLLFAVSRTIFWPAREPGRGGGYAQRADGPHHLPCRPEEPPANLQGGERTGRPGPFRKNQSRPAGGGDLHCHQSGQHRGGDVHPHHQSASDRHSGRMRHHPAGAGGGGRAGHLLSRHGTEPYCGSPDSGRRARRILHEGPVREPGAVHRPAGAVRGEEEKYGTF